MNPVRALSDVLAFALELVALVVLAWWGSGLGPTLLTHVVGAVVAPLLFILLWARWLAPRAARRLPMPWLVVAKLALYAAPVLALVALGRPGLAVAMAAAVLVSLTAATALGAP